MKEFSPSEAIILLLDSDSVSRAVLREALERANYLVVAAGDLARAVERLHDTQVDLLITRPYINSMPGAFAANYLRTRRAGLPVLVIAGFPDDDRIRNPLEEAQYFTFPKPFRLDDFVANVKEVIAKIREKPE
jgi:DNA-binding NtrC family response regulator